MKQLRTNPDEVVDLHRRIAFADACLDTLNFDQMLTRVCSLLNEWVQADVVTLILPPEDETLEPMLHLYGQQPVLPLSEQCIRSDSAALLAELEYAHLSGDSLRLRRGADLRPINGVIRDDAMYRFWWHDLKLHGETVGVIALYGFIDWVLSARIKRLLNSLVPTLTHAINNAAAIENFRASVERDEVTSGLNQRGLFEALDRECARSMEKQCEMSVILFQLETFESVAGTIAGEKVLQAFYEVARKQLRPYHQIGRIAEGEFVVILPEVNESEVDIIARRIVAAASQIIVDDEPMITRFGRASAQGASTDDLLQKADHHLYESRKAISTYDQTAG